MIEADNSFFTKRVFVIAGIIFSGLCWYFSNGLNGSYWYLLWLAPIPLFVISLHSTGKKTLIVAFFAYLIGRLSWVTYLITVATVIPAIIFTLALPLIFALIIMLTRKTVIKLNSWYSIFAFPVFFTSFEFLMMRFSPDGTAASIAYSQSNFLPVIQIASVTGIFGITFLVTFIPSAIAISWYYRRENRKFRRAVIVSGLLVVAVFIFGILRLAHASHKTSIKVGLAVLDEHFHHITNHPDYQQEIQTAENYAQQITRLASQGAQLVVLPERAININKVTDSAVMRIFSFAAKQNHVALITGYTNFKNVPERNSSLVINADGNVITDYNKVHLVTGLENQFTPGAQPGLFMFNGVQSGVAICKDMDFPAYIRKYSVEHVAVLYIPAWDFVADDWLHSRMAVLRGVEDGFSEVRAARQGRLTISDCYGRVSSEANSSNGMQTTLTGNVSLQKTDTIYTHFGDWFGIVNLMATGCFIFLTWKKRE